MKLQLKKPLCFFDLETTGTDISKDRIIEIAILKLYPDGKKETLETRINPEIPIPIEASMVHGIDPGGVHRYRRRARLRGSFECWRRAD